MDSIDRSLLVRHLEEMLAYHEEIIRATRLVLGSLTVAEPKPAPEDPAPLALVETNSNGHKDPAALRASANAAIRALSGESKTARETRERRERTAELLAKFSRTEPRSGMGKIGPLVANGYLLRKGTGFVRSAREFVVDPDDAA